MEWGSPGAMQNLTIMTLRDNSLTGTLPASWCARPRNLAYIVNNPGPACANARRALVRVPTRCCHQSCLPTAPMQTGRVLGEPYVPMIIIQIYPTDLRPCQGLLLPCEYSQALPWQCCLRDTRRDRAGAQPTACLCSRTCISGAISCVGPSRRAGRRACRVCNN